MTDRTAWGLGLATVTAAGTTLDVWYPAPALGTPPATLDVTAPEPLPDGHPLWTLERCIISPHTANTPEMAMPLLTARVAENVRRFAAGEPLIGPVDVDLGY